NGTELSKKPAREVNEVNALVDELAPARNFRVRAPLAFVTQTASMTVTATDEHQRPQDAAVHELARLPKCGMVAMVDSDPQATTSTSHGVAHGRDLAN